MLSTHRHFLGLISAACVLVGCGRDYETQRVDTLKAVQSANYQAAVGELNELYDSYDVGEPKKAGGPAQDTADIDDKESLVWHMERGAVAQIAGDFPVSDRHFDEAARLVDERRTKSLTREIGTGVVNDTLREYAGQGFEHTQVDYFRALNRLVEAQRDRGVMKPTALTLPVFNGTTTDHAPLPPKDPGPAAYQPDELYSHAMGMVRRMTISQLIETADSADGNRYSDDPFARLMAALTTLALPPVNRDESDRQFADVMVKKALVGYQDLFEKLSSDKHLRYETARRPKLLDTLMVRVCRNYDQDWFDQRAKEFGFSENDPRLTELTTPKGMGSVLILNHVGFVTRPEALSFRLIAGAMNSSPPSPGSCSSSIGGLMFWVTGPGNESVAVLPPIFLPPDLVRNILAPGGAAYLGFEIPAQVTDKPIPAPARVVLRNMGAATGEIPATLEVVSDIDAYARATLNDHRPGVVTKTLIRAATKQLIAGGISKQVRNTELDKGGTGLIGAAVNLLSSSIATLSEEADVRAWTTLPDHIESALIDVPPGTWLITIDPGIGAATVATVTVQAGCVSVVPVRTFPPGMQAPDLFTSKPPRSSQPPDSTSSPGSPSPSSTH